MKTNRYALILTLCSFGNGLLASILSLAFLAKGLTLSTIGFGLTAFSAAAVLLEVPSGVAADMLGKKRVFILSMAVTAAAYLIILPGFGPLWTIGGLALYGVGRALSSGTMEALFVSRYRSAFGPENLPKGMKILTVCDSVGLGLGALIGGILPAVGASLFPQLGPYDLPLLLRALLPLTAASLAAVLIPNDVKDEHEQSASLKRQLQEGASLFRGSRNLKGLLIAVVGVGFALAFLEVYWQPRMLELMGGGQDKTVYLGVMSLMYFAAVAVGSLISEKTLKPGRISQKALFLSSRIIMLLLLVGAAFAGHPAVFAAAYCAAYFMLGASNVAEGSIFHMEVPDSQRASFLSMQSLLLQVGFMTASAISGALVEAFSISGTWVIGAVVAAALMLPSFGMKAAAPSPAAAAAEEKGA
jgi:MFS family permease